MTRGGEMTLEQAIADWRDQIGKLTAERDDLREKLLVEEGLVREFHDRYIAQLMASEKLIAECDAWRKLVLEHNAECERLCKSGTCGYATYRDKAGRRCPECNLYDVIDIPPELEQP